MDINKVWISGTAMSQPTISKLPSQTDICSFTMCVVEEFSDKNGNSKERPTHIVVEALGKSAHSAMNKIRLGKRFFIEGYLREEVQSGVSIIRLRAFVINEDKPNQSSLKLALSILKKAPSLEEAIKKVEEEIKKD